MMNVTIQQITDFLGINSNTFFSTSITILIFGLGIIINALSKRINQYRKRRIVRKNGRYTLEELIRILERQEKEYKDFSSSLTIDREPQFKLSQMANPFNEIWKMLPFATYFDAYCAPLFLCKKKLRRKALNKVYHHIKNIENTENRAVKDFEEISLKYNKYNNNWNIGTDNIRKVLDYYLNLPNKNQNELNLISEFGPIMHEWSKSELWNYNLIIEKFFTRLRAMVEKYKGDTQLLIIINSIVDCEVAKQNIEGLFKKNERQFKRFAINYRLTSRILTRCIQIL